MFESALGRVATGLVLVGAVAGCARYRCPMEIPVELEGSTRTAVASAGSDSVAYTLAAPSVECFPGDWPRVRTRRVERAWRDQLYVVASVEIGPAGRPVSAAPLVRIVALAADGSEVAAAEVGVTEPSGGVGQARAVLELPEEQVKRIHAIRVGWLRPGGA